jgi:peptide/nickel transport system substrate-binding protein
MLRNEVDNLAAKVVGPNAPERTRRMFNAELVLFDGTGVPLPYLAESIPQLNSSTWQVFPDGRMETTYRLRPALTWQDGAPLTADDFVFAWRLYASPALGLFTSSPQQLVDEVSAPDPLTVLIKWNATYPEAGALAYDTLPPLPRHILESGAATIDDPAGRDAFASSSFWTTDYVGAGPYRLTRWQAGYEMEGAAFDGHALGKPRIERVIARIMNDENAALTALLAGDADYAEGFVLQFEHAQVLQQDWAPSGKGIVLVFPDATSNHAVQFRPEYQKSPPLLDLRVRRAIAHAIDREAINEGVFGGQGIISETYVTPQNPTFAAVDKAITKYPYDPRRTEQLMTEAGLVKDGEGLFANRGERFRPDYWITAGTQSERAAAIIAETWRRAGIDNAPYVLPLAAGRDNEVRATFPGMTQIGLSSRDDTVRNFITSQIGTPARAWRGDNRGGWVSPEADRLYEAFNSTLDPTERTRAWVEMAHLVSDQLPVFVFYPNIRVRAFISALRGPEIGSPTTLPRWNMHEWAWVS